MNTSLYSKHVNNNQRRNLVTFSIGMNILKPESRAFTAYNIISDKLKETKNSFEVLILESIVGDKLVLYFQELTIFRTDRRAMVVT